MKKIGLLVAVVGMLTLCANIWVDNPQATHFIASPRNSGGAAPGKTGAPGEMNCTQCHDGSVQDGTAENILLISQGGAPVNNYTPGQQYSVNLSMISNPVKRGFQATALNSNNAMAGFFTGLAGNTSINGAARKYANHTSSSNTSAAAPNWSWTWTAPSAGTGDVTFYVATNKTNNNGNDNGDMIYLSQFVIQESSNVGLEEEISNFSIVGLSQETISLRAKDAIGRLEGISIHDTNGKLLSFTPEVQAENGLFIINRPSQMQKGLYFLTFQANSRLISKKIYG